MSILCRVAIQGFKSIRDVEVDLGQLNVLIGTNGGGKSNFLEAVGMLSTAVSGELDYARLAERGVRLSTPEVFKSAFKNTISKGHFSLTGEFDQLRYKVDVSAKANEENLLNYFTEKLDGGFDFSKKIAGRSNHGASIPDAKNFTPDNFSSGNGIVSACEHLGVLKSDEKKAINALKGFAIFAPSTPVLRGISEDGSRKEPLGLYGGSLANALHKLIGEKNKDIFRFFLLIDWASSCGIDNPIASLQSNHIHTGHSVVCFTDKYMKKNFKRLYAYDVSEGALYVIFLLTLLLHPNTPNIFAIDNFDSTLNPGLVRGVMQHVAEILKEKPHKQIFLTTHNPTALDALDLFDETHRLFVVKRDANGATTLDRIQPPPGMTKEQWGEEYGEMKLSEIWLSGAFKGALPRNY